MTQVRSEGAIAAWLSAGNGGGRQENDNRIAKFAEADGLAARENPCGFIEGLCIE